jgi:hypothetical protein
MDTGDSFSRVREKSGQSVKCCGLKCTKKPHELKSDDGGKRGTKRGIPERVINREQFGGNNPLARENHA